MINNTIGKFALIRRKVEPKVQESTLTEVKSPEELAVEREAERAYAIKRSTVTHQVKMKGLEIAAQLNKMKPSALIETYKLYEMSGLNLEKPELKVVANEVLHNSLEKPVLNNPNLVIGDPISYEVVESVLPVQDQKADSEPTNVYLVSESKDVYNCPKRTINLSRKLESKVQEPNLEKITLEEPDNRNYEELSPQEQKSYLLETIVGEGFINCVKNFRVKPKEFIHAYKIKIKEFALAYGVEVSPVGKLTNNEWERN